MVNEFTRIKHVAESAFEAFALIKSELNNGQDIKLDNDSMIARIKQFPFGCCVDASIVLKAIYNDIEIKNVLYVEQTYGADFFHVCSNHVWLRWNDYNIDLTLGQFIKKYKEEIFLDVNHPLSENNCKAIETWPEHWRTGKVEVYSNKGEIYAYRKLIKQINHRIKL